MSEGRVYIGIRVDKVHPGYIANHLMYATWSILSLTRKIEQVAIKQLT